MHTLINRSTCGDEHYISPLNSKINGYIIDQMDA